MISLESSLEQRRESFDQVRDYLYEHQFTLGGNWDFDHGYFDRALDGEAHKVWLRIPFQVTHGAIDANAEETTATIQIGSPFVLKHLYNEGLDPEAQVRSFGGLIDQFQEPVDKDAPVEQKWVAEAKELLHQVEAGWLL